MARRHRWAMTTNIKIIDFDVYKSDDFENFLINIYQKKDEGCSQFMDSYYWYLENGFNL